MVARANNCVVAMYNVCSLVAMVTECTVLDVPSLDSSDHRCCPAPQCQHHHRPFMAVYSLVIAVGSSCSVHWERPPVQVAACVCSCGNIVAAIL